MPLRPVPIDVSFPALEREVLEWWRRERAFERSVELREGRPAYVFYDGPPFATGMPHYGHILTSYIKDVVPRYFTMRGRHVPRRWGWDCHGLPVEFEIEKELGLKSRADIVAYGIGPFNAACRDSVLRYADEWRRIIGRLGRWVDFDHDYKTMDADYMESVVWAFKALHERGLVYEGNKVVPFCTRCQTTLSNFEARQDDAFRPRQDPAITVKFRRDSAPGEAFLAWTTTPWTLPSNVALAVGADIEYVAVDHAGERLWLAAAAVDRYARELGAASVVERRLGRELVGAGYTPLFPYFADTPGGFRVLAGDFVTTEDGTGIVHLAPAFGEDDAALCAAHGIAGPNPVEDDGTFTAAVGDVAGQHVFAANGPLSKLLERQGALLRKSSYEHNYPHCWRCDNPLIYRAIKTWFISVTTIKPGMLAANQRIRWIPDHIQGGRFGNWLENARDWAVSRNRFWGAPIPVWRCDRCAAIEVIGGRADLEARSGRPLTDWHRPAIDDYSWPCAACAGGAMRRVADVLDCWFESGSMPYGQVHYPFERKAEFEASYPGDFIVEYIAQTRGWFYTMVVLAAALFDKPPFRDAVCHGVILAEDGRKMSKRLKNYPDPMELVEQHGSDALRIALLSSAAVRGSDLRFSARAVHDAVKEVAIPLWNSLHYYTAYAGIDGFAATGTISGPARLDRWLLSETEALRAGLEQAMGGHDYAACYDLLRDFIDGLSRWYIRLSKARLWRAGLDADKRAAYETLHAALATLARLAAPFVPFLAEQVHRALGGADSVHLEDWPSPRPEWSDPALSAEMRRVRAIVRLARSIREEHRVKHRHPLRAVSIAAPAALALLAADGELLAEELNVKQVRALTDPREYVKRTAVLDYGVVGRKLRGDVKKVQAALDAGAFELEGDQLHAAGFTLGRGEFTTRFVAQPGLGVAAEAGLVVVLDLASDPELIAEGQMRDLNRGLQDLRKKAGLAYADRIAVAIEAGDGLAAVIAARRGWLAAQVLAVDVTLGPLAEPLARDEIEVGEERVVIALRRAV